MCDLSNPRFHNEDAARKYLEKIRWPDGPVCAFCGQLSTVRPVRGKSMGPGWYYCTDCQDKFTVRVGTIYERSHIPLHKWVMAMHLMAASKKGISAHQLHRMLGITYKSAWFMSHRIREAMRDDNPSPMGGPGSAVQADETYYGQKKGATRRRGGSGHKHAIVSLITDGKARSFHVARANAKTVRQILVTNVRRETELHTDESRIYKQVGEEFADHKTVIHIRGQYVGPSGESTNKVENYFSIFKRGMRGVYQHCADKHLQRYINEFDFRYSTRDLEDADRADLAHKQAEGKRLTYRRTSLG
ncbi:MAG: IS1595 family transposase [Proteobacteria bacterium]|nr:IS1595 family transposase [Pseudomonadota bacterium]